MYMRKLISVLLAVLFISVTVISPVFADGTPAGGTSGDGSIHPWDINDGTPTGGGTGDVVAPSLSVIVFWYGPFGELLGSMATISSLSRVSTTTELSKQQPTSTKSLKRSDLSTRKAEY